MARPDPAIDRRPDQGRAWKAVLIFVGLFLVILAISLRTGSRTPSKSSLPRRAPSVAARAGYVGSKSCAECHPGEFASHSRSGHARTLRRAARTALAGRLSGKTVRRSGAAGGELSLRIAKRRILDRAARGQIVSNDG